MLKGDAGTAIADPGSILITETFAKKYFGDEDPVGKVLRQDNQWNSRVTGVIKDPPRNSSRNLQFAYLEPFQVVGFWKEPDSWSGSNDFQTYVLLHPEASVEGVNDKIRELTQKHLGQAGVDFFLQPLTRMHLRSDFDYDAPHGDIKLVTVLIIVACSVLLIACINFMNLTTARFTRRVKEIGLRKVVGARRRQIMGQFFGEAILFAFIALPFALLIVELALPVFNNLVGKPLRLNLSDYSLVLGSVVITAVTGLLSGIYPALFLSSFRPVAILKGQLPLMPVRRVGTRSRGHTNIASLRKALVVLQFALSIMVIIGSMVVTSQVAYLRGKNLGFDKENLLYVNAGANLSKVYGAMKQELVQRPDIKSTTATSEMITALPTFGNVTWEGEEGNRSTKCQRITVNDDFLETYDLNMARGRFFSRRFSTDEGDAFVVNETAVEAMGLDEPLGKRIRLAGREGSIVGVVNDFHFRPLHEKITPLIMELGRLGQAYEFFHLTVRVQSDDLAQTIRAVQSAVRNYCPESSADFHFIDAERGRHYASEQRLGKIFSHFSILIIVVACLGLFGLATFTAEARTKEIGIRRVLGASVAGIAFSLSGDFARWVLLANLVAWPVAYSIIQRWLENFAYRIEMSWWTFSLAGCLAFAVAFLTVAALSIKAATASPVESLRYE